MTTGNFANWVGNIADLGPLYPFVGSEFLLTIIGVVFWVAWHLWQICHEKKTTAENLKKLRESPGGG